MAATNDRTVTVFGGTGFLGRRIVRNLRAYGFPVWTASRHPDRGHRLFGPDDPKLQSVEANIHDERSVADATAGAYGVVNAVSLYVEHGQDTFHSVHVEAAQRVAAQALRAGVDRLIHISGNRRRCRLTIGGDALFLRPAVMFGPDDAFLTTILRLLRQLPIYPMFGRGLTRLQPAYVEDVAEAVRRTMQRAETPSTIFEFGGPRVYSYEEFLRAVAHQAGLAPRLNSNPVCGLECTRMGL